MDSVIAPKALAAGNSKRITALSVSRSWRLSVALVLLVAGALRLYGLEQDGLWFDTVHSVALADSPGVAEVIRGAAVDFQSPLYFLLLHFWLSLGYTDVWAKLLSVFIGLATVAITFVLAESMFSRRTAVMAGLLTALSSYQVFYSRYPRAYILMALLVLVSTWALYSGLKDGKARSLGLFAFATILGLYTHPYYALIVFAQAVFTAGYVLAKSPARLHSLTMWGSIYVFVLLAFAPWIGVMLAQWSGVQAGADEWITPVGVDSLQQLFFWLWHRTKGDYWPLVALPLWAGVYSLTALLLLSLFKRKKGSEKLLLSSLVFCPIVLSFGISILGKPLWDPRYFVYISAPFYILVAQAIAEPPELLRRWAWASKALPFVLVFAVSLPPLYSLYTDPNYKTPELKESAAWLQRQYRDGDIIMHVNYQSYLPYLWYSLSLPARPLLGAASHAVPCVWPSLPERWCRQSPYRQSLLSQEPKGLSLKDAETKRVWLVALYNHTWELENESRKVDETVNRITGGLYEKLSTHRFLGVNVYELKPFS